MEQEKPITAELKGLKTYCQSWKQFIDRAMEIIVQNPVTSRYVMKYNPRKHIFILKVTDNTKIAMIKCSGDNGYDQVQKFTKLAARALTNQSDKKAEQTKEQQSKEGKKKKNKKKR